MAGKEGRNYHRTVALYDRRLKRKAQEFNVARPLDPLMIDMVGDKKEVSILSVGSGPFATFGNTLDGVKINITMMDMLADEYNEMIDRQGIEPMFRPELGDMEDIHYPDNAFDIVHSQNAIDHTKDIRKALSEIYRVCKPGGWIYLHHIRNEGQNTRYKNLHTWNIEQAENDCRVWNRQESFMMSEYLNGLSVKNHRYWVTCICQKNNQI